MNKGAIKKEKDYGNYNGLVKNKLYKFYYEKYYLYYLDYYLSHFIHQVFYFIITVIILPNEKSRKKIIKF